MPLRAEGGGKLMTLVLTPGQRHESVAFEALMASGAVKRHGPGRPKRRPRRVSGDKAYSSGKIRQYLRRHGIRITIPHKQNEGQTGPLDLPPSGSGGASDQPAEAKPASGHALREVCGKLPRDVVDRSDVVMAIVCKHALDFLPMEKLALRPSTHTNSG